MLSFAHLDFMYRMALGAAPGLLVPLVEGRLVVSLPGFKAVDVSHWLPNMPRGSEDSYGRRAPVIRAANAPS